MDHLQDELSPDQFIPIHMLFRLHFLLYCIFVSYNQFLFSFLHFILCRMCVCHMFNKVLTYLLTYKLTGAKFEPQTIDE